ncbi:MAG: tRNA uridine-5-carboxymethylaminomethyl(34) synthesis GTPase MnmE [Janthinobacterium lividum]
MAMVNEETICALATPPGTGGLGVIRVSGPEAFAIVDRVSRRPKQASCAVFKSHTLHRASIVDADGVVIDDVLLSIFHNPRSYTGEDVVEISAHGSPLIIGRIMARLLQSGARTARPGEFTQRAFLNGKMDLTQAEAVGDLIAAQTEQAQRQAQRQSEGRLSKAVLKIRVGILGVLAQIEASIDFPEEVGELNISDCETELGKSQCQIADLLATADQGILYREGLQVVLAGRPNVGKSSLLNALLRTNRAIVTSVPGTTRDVIEETLNLHGIPLRVSDTAGLRETENEVEVIGVARTRESIAGADIVLLVLDSVSGETPEDLTLRQTLLGRPHLTVWNKWDLQAETEPPSHGTPVSALTGWNLDALETAITQLALGDAADGTESALVTHARHKQALQSAASQITDAAHSLQSGLPADFASIDLRGALDALGQITGETATEDIIAEIFSRFCIGK